MLVRVIKGINHDLWSWEYGTVFNDFVVIIIFGEDVWVESRPITRWDPCDSSIHSSKMLYQRTFPTASNSHHKRTPRNRVISEALSTLASKKAAVLFNHDNKHYTPAFIDPSDKVYYSQKRKCYQAAMMNSLNFSNRNSKTIIQKKIL